jgi:hypothetical protein
VAEALSHLPTARELTVAPGATARLALALYPADRQLVRRQLHALAARGELNVLAPEIALALCRVHGADEALLAREERGGGGRQRLSFTRLSCASGKILGRQDETAPPDRAEGAAQHALATLWPVAPATPPAAARTTPVYKRWWFWTVIGLGTGAAVAGTVLGVRAARGPDTYTIRMSP